MTHKLPDEVILQIVIDWRATHKHWPMRSEFPDPNLPNLTLCDERFGNLDAMRWAAAILCNDLTPEQRAEIARLRPIILTQLQRVIDYLAPRRLTPHSLKATPPQIRPLISDIARYCGGLNAAMRMLGLMVPYPTEQDLLQALRQAATDMGRTPTLNDCGTESLPYARSCFDRTFASWRDAIVMTGLTPKVGRPKGKRNLACDRSDFEERKAARRREAAKKRVSQAA